MKKNNLSKAQEHIEVLLQEFLNDFSVEHKHKKNLTSDFHAEEGRKIGYKGREILELLQNVDDEYERLCQENPEKKGQEVACLIEYKDNILRVCNTGTAFTEDAIDSICQAATSSKGEKYIGQKGIGFRSILNWAKEIHIYSGDYSVGFSEEFASEKLREIASKSETVRMQLERERKNKKSELKIPMLNAPHWIERKTFDYLENYDTVIEIVVKPETQNDDWSIEKQIKKFDENILLFLPNLTRINFIINDAKYTFSKKIDSTNSKIIKLLIESAERSEKIEYYVYSPKTDILIQNRKLKMSIAIPNDKNGVSSKPLYTFFPIGKQKSPFNALFHASFDLDDNRETISSLPINKEIFKELLKFYVDTVTENFCKPEFKNRCLELLCPKDFSSSFTFETPFNTEEILEYYLDLCREKAQFFTVNENFISNSDNPKIIKDAPKFFKGEIFSDLLIPIKESLDCFVREITDDISFSDSELCERINKLSKKLSIKQRVEVFIWWITNKNTSYYLPKLLQDNTKENEWLSFGSTCFLSGEIANIPEWADFRFLDNKYEKELKEHYPQFSFNLPQYNKFINFENFTIESIISPLNEKVNDDFDKSVDFVRFLYINFDTIKDIESLKEISFNFPNVNGEVSYSIDLYFGKEYGNDFSEKILEIAGYTKVCSIKTLGLKNVSQNDIKKFLAYFGCVEYPKIKSEYKIYYTYDYGRTYTGNRDYELFIKNKYNYSYYICSISGKSIDNIMNIISNQNLNMNIIIKWIFDDKELKNELFEKNSTIELSYKAAKQAPNCSKKVIYDTSYLNYVFSTTKWLEINGEKYAPSECLFSEDSLLAKYTPCISKDWIEQNHCNFSKKEFKELLSKLGVKNKISELDSEQFYSLLLKLQEDDITYKLSESIYRNVVEDRKNNYFEDSNAKQIFEKTGKVWTKNNHYQSVSNVFFSSSAVVNINNNFLIDLPLRTGSKELVQKVFFVFPYEEKYIIDVDSIQISHLDKEFQKDFIEYLPYVYCYRKENADASEQRKFQNLKITIVDTIKIKIDNNLNFINNAYTLLQNTENQNLWYIYFDGTTLDKNKISELLEQIFSIIINSQNLDLLQKFSELFVADRERRNYLIERNFLNLDILHESRNILRGIESEKDLLVEWLKKNNKLSIELKNLIYELDFSSVNTISTQEKIFLLLNKIEIDVEDLNDILERKDISIRLYNLQRLKNYFSVNESKFKYALYNDLKVKSMEEKKLFLDKIEEYEKCIERIDFSIDNSILFDVKYTFCNLLNKALGLSGDLIINSTNEENIDSYYADNMQLLKSKFSDSENNIESFTSTQFVRSLFYFDYENIEKQFLQWKENESKLKQEATKTEDKRNMVLNFHIDEVKPVIKNPNSSFKQKSYRTVTSMERNAIEKELRKQGDNAEYEVYKAIFENTTNNHNDFIKKLNIDNNDYRLGQISEGLGRVLNLNGRDDLGYDIELINKETGEKLFIEVKSSKGSVCQFDMSENELNFAKEHSDNYRLIFVGDMEKENHSIQVLPKQFWNIKEDYKIVPKDYTIQCVRKMSPCLELR